MLEDIIIGFVLHEPLTGYDIKKTIDAGLGNFYKASHGSLYPALKKLTDKGYITMTEQPQGKRVKKNYMATEAGKAAFFSWLSMPFDPKTHDDTYMAQIFFFGELPREQRLERLRDYEFYIQQMLRELQPVEKQLSAESFDDRDYFQAAAFYFSYQILQNTMRWLKYITEQKPLSAFLEKEAED